MTIHKRATARLGDRLANSATVLWVTQVCMRVLQVATIAIMARLLNPADYGVVSLALVILGFIDLLSNIQVGSAIIKLAELDRQHLDTAFTLNLLRGVLIAGMIGIIARPAGHFMHDARLANVLYVLMLTSILRAFENPHFILYSRNLDFTRESKRNTISLIAGCTVGIAAAFAWHSYWALVMNALASSLVSVVLSYWRVPGRPGLSLAKCGDLFGFGSWIVLVNILDYINWQVEYLIIGNRIGAAALGAYNVGSSLTGAATMDVVNAISKALLPAFSIMSDDMARLRMRYTEVQSITLALALPIGVGMSALAGNVVRLLVGAKWYLAIPVIEIVAPTFAIQTLVSNVESLAYSLGKGRLIFVRTCVFLVFRSALMIGGYLAGGFMGIVYARAINGVCNVGYSLLLVKQLTGAPALEPLKASWRTFISAAVMWAVLTQWPFPDAAGLSAWSLTARLIAKIGIGAAVYVGTVFVLWLAAGRPEGAETRIISQGRRMIGKIKLRQGKKQHLF